MENDIKSTVSKVNLSEKIRELCREKDAAILAHYYVDGEIQDSVE